MKGAQSYWSGSKIECCKDCVAPKRHLGCHSTCKEYKEEKARWEETKEKIRANKAEAPKINSYDFNEISYAGCKRHKCRKNRV